MFDIIAPTIVQGLIYGIGSIGLALTYRYLRFADFTSIGSLIVGGITCIWAFNTYGSPYIGILVGVIIGAFLGLCTGLLHATVRIQEVLSGIIVSFASITIGYNFAPNGTLSILEQSENILHPIFHFNDVIVIMFFLAIVCIFLGIMMSSTFGILLLGMTADSEFLSNRHNKKLKTFLITTIIGNSIIGLAGALYSLRVNSATVSDHAEFLLLSLGAIYGADALFKLFTMVIHYQGFADLLTGKNKQNSILLKLANLFSKENDDAKTFGILCAFYAFCMLFLQSIGQFVKGGGLESLSSNFSFPKTYQYAIQSFFIFLFALLGRKND